MDNSKLDFSLNQKVLLSGAFSGFLSLFVFVPSDLLKCRAQLHRHGSMSYLKETRFILTNNGLQGLYRGFWASAWRDIPGWAVYFWVYEVLKKNQPHFGDCAEKRGRLS